MRSTSLRRLAATFLTAGLGVGVVSAGNLDQLNYLGVPGSRVADLRNDPNNAAIFPEFPYDGNPFIELIDPAITVPPPTFIESYKGSNPQDSATWLRGFIEPPQTGSYTFWVTGTDDAEFKLSPTTSASGAVIEAYTGGGTGNNEWARRLTQKSRQIQLVKGQQYYFELTQKSSGTGGAAQLGWWLPDFTLQRPIPIRYAQRFAFAADCIFLCTGSFVNEKSVNPPQFDRNPGNNTSGQNSVVSLIENQSYDLTPWLTANYPIAFQWQQMVGYVPNGSQGTATDIAGDITAAKYIAAASVANNDGKAYRLKATRNGTDTFSTVVYLSVLQDFTAPTIASAAVSGNTNGFNVVFSENVDPTTATNKANYTVNNGVTVTRVEMLYGQTPNSTVVIYTDKPIPGLSTVTVKNVRDLSTYQPDGTAGNPIQAPGNVADIFLTDGIISQFDYGAVNGGSGISGVNITDLVNATNRFTDPFLEVGGTFVQTSSGGLTNRFHFPGNPDLRDTPTQVGVPNNIADNYGVQIVGFVIPPVTGLYNIVIATDDGGMVYMGTDENPATRYAVAAEPVWNGWRTYTGTARRSMSATGNSGVITSNFPGSPAAAQNSTLVVNQSKNHGGTPLVKGNKYYFEALMKENGGGDNLDVTWQLPGTWSANNNNGLSDGQAPIQGTYLSLFASQGQSGPVTITAQPTGGTTLENRPFTMTVGHGGSPSFTYQWYKNGIVIPDANSITYTEPLPDPVTENNAKYTVVVRNLFSQGTSGEATLTVTTDLVGPKLVRAVGSATFNSVTIWFDEVVDPATATSPGNYSIKETGGTATLSLFGTGTLSAPAPGGYTRVTFQTGTQTAGKNYTITVNNVTDIANSHNAITANSTVTFTGWVISKGFVLYNRYDNTSGGSLAGLYANPIYPNSPSFTTYKTEWHQAQTDPNLDNYGGVHTGFFYPDQTGRYEFYFSGDDNGGLWVSSDLTPANKVQVASEPGWRGEYEWTGVGSGGTANGVNNTLGKTYNPPVTDMVAGQARWMELIQVEGGGGDTSAATFREPSESSNPANGTPSRMVGPYIGAYANPDETEFTFLTQPASVTGSEVTSVTFNVDGNGKTLSDKLNNPQTSASIFWQWQKKATNAGAVFVDIPGANGRSYNTALLTPQDNGAQFRALASIPGLTSTSDVATVTVVVDVTPPTITAVTGSLPNPINGPENTVTVYFSERVSKSLAEDISHYSIVNGANALAVTAASLSSDARIVTLTTAAQTPGTVYTATITGITDISQGALVIAPNPTVKTFTAWTLATGVIRRQLYYDIGGTSLGDLTNNAKYPNKPDLDGYVPLFEEPPSDCCGAPNRENFGTRITGLLTPTETADYYFAISGDDNQGFYLSTDADPANRRLVVAEPQWNGYRSWSTSDRRVGANNFFPGVTTLPINNSSNTVGAITLTAGQSYYAMSLGKEGGGGDSDAVLWWKKGTDRPADNSPSISGSQVLNYVNPDNAITITSQPAGKTVGPGTNATFSVAATTYEPKFGGPVTYQWRRGGTPITGATGSSYTITAASGDNGASFDVIVSAPGATSVTSTAATLTVDTGGNVPAPTLAITKTGNNVVVTYPTTAQAAGHLLEKTTGLPGGFAADTGTDVSGTYTKVVDLTVGGVADQSYWRTKK